MPAQKRFKSDYPGVHYIIGTSITTGKPERIYMIMYRKDGRLIEEKVGRQYQDAMTPAKAARVRARRIEGKALSNRERREKQKEEKREKDARWTLSRLWAEYKEIRQPKSIVSDDNRFKNYLKPAFGDKELKDIDPLSIDRLRLKMLKIRKPQTVAHVIEIIRRVSNFAVKKRLCPGLNFKISLPPFNNEKTEDLAPAELSNLLKAIEEDEHEQAGKMLLLALYLGLRRNEIFSLTWDKVDFQNGFVWLREAKGEQNEKVPLNEAARKVLEGIPRTNGNPFVFPSGDGGQWFDIKKRVNLIKQKAGIPKSFRIFHGLRHVFASRLASSGKVDLYTLQKLLRHRSPEMVQRYAHLRDDTLRRASELAGELVSEAVKEAEQEEKADNMIPLR